MFNGALLCIIICSILSLCARGFANQARMDLIGRNMHAYKRRGKIGKTMTPFMSSGVDEVSSDVIAAKEAVEASARVSAFNLAKCIGGVGLFSLPAGVALFSDAKKALIPSAVICTFLGLVAAYTFILYGRGCAHYNTTSLKETWEEAVGKGSGWVVSSSSTLKTLFTCLTFSIVIGDSFRDLAVSMGAPKLLQSRSNMILGMTSGIVLPLCLLESLDALTPFSAMGMAGTLYTAVFMTIRALDGSYAPGGRFHSTIAHSMQPVFNSRPHGISSLTLVLVSMLSTAYIAHYNAPAFYSELRNNTSKRFNRVTMAGFGSAIVLTLWVISTGFLTFGGNCNGYVLNNYSRLDTLASIARFAVGVTLLTSYPFTFTALRTGIMDTLGVSASQRDEFHVPMTVSVLSLVTAAALVVKNVGFAVSFAGALFGNALMYCMPAIIEKRRVEAMGTANLRNRLVNNAILLFGAILGLLGAIVCVLREMGRI